MFREIDIVNAYKEFKRANSTRKKIQITENVYVDFKRRKTENITASLFLRSTYIKKFFNKNILTIDKIEFYYDKNKNLKIKNRELKREDLILDAIEYYKKAFLKELDKLLQEKEVQKDKEGVKTNRFSDFTFLFNY